ncbi:MAG: hypothetical protein ABI867_25700 [Kofleriaceae bacterium]
MRAVAVVLSLSLSVSVGCFPDNARHRTIAKLTEGGFLVGGITILAVANTQADCDMDTRPGVGTMDCKSRNSFISGLGLTMILVGLVGFFATVTTEPDDDAKPAPAPLPSVTPPPPSTTPTPIAAPTTPAPAALTP